MTNLKTNEFFRDYIAIQNEYFSNLKQLTDPKELNGKLVNNVLINGEEYERIEWTKKNQLHMQLIPKSNFQMLPIIELTVGDNYIQAQIHKFLSEGVLEYTKYASVLRSKNIEASLNTWCYDVSDELSDKSYASKSFIKKIPQLKNIKKMIEYRDIEATRYDWGTFYSPLYNNTILRANSINNNDTSLFELLKGLSEQMINENKTK